MQFCTKPCINEGLEISGGAMRMWKLFGCGVLCGLVMIILYAAFSDVHSIEIRQRKIKPRYKIPVHHNHEPSRPKEKDKEVNSNPAENSTRLPPAISSRVLQLQSGCQKLRDEGLSFTEVPRSELQHLIVDDEYRVLYCYIPKVACTNLKRVFLLLTGLMNETEPLKLKSSDVHLTYTKYLKFLNTYSEEEIIYKIKNYRKVLFVREPLERLLSAYRNKFTQKGGAYFQQRFGRKIIRHFRDNPLEESLNHGDDVTFKEFVQFLLDPTMEPNGHNEHWAPMSDLCHPCHLSYDFIGKYETLDDDVTLLLKEMSVYDRIRFPERGDTYKNERTEDTMMDHFKLLQPRYLNEVWKIYLHDYILFGYPYPAVIRKLLSDHVDA